MKTLLIVGLIAYGGVACALTNHTLQQPYVTASTATQAAPARAIIWQQLTLAPTLQADADAVGVKKNGYGMETSTIYTAPPAPQWLNQAALLEMQGVGLQPDEHAPDAPIVHIRAAQFFAEPDVGFWGADLVATTVLDVSVTLAGSNKVYQRRFVGESNGFTWIWSDSLYDGRLLQSAQRALGQAAPEIRHLIDSQQNQGDSHASLLN